MIQSLETLPRLRDLHTRFSSKLKDNFFRDFPARLNGVSGVTFQYYSKIENWLSYVPAAEWGIYCEKIKLTANIHDKYRHWEGLHTVFNEALGAKILATRYRCRDMSLIRALPIKKGHLPKSPDWVGHSLSLTTFVEVKTLNHSQEERESWYTGGQPVHLTQVSPQLEKKIKTTYYQAIEQLSAVGSPKNRKLVLFVLNRDYSFDPIDQSIKSVVLSWFNKLERKEFPIAIHIQGP
jgi:hypothetical protein